MQSHIDEVSACYIEIKKKPHTRQSIIDS